MPREFGVMRCLNSLVDDTIDDTQRIKVEVDALALALGNLLVLLVEVVVELSRLLDHGWQIPVPGYTHSWAIVTLKVSRFLKPQLT